MTALTAALFTAGLLLSAAAALAAWITRATADPADRAFTRALATAGQAAVGLGLLALARYDYHPGRLILDVIYAAMVLALAAFATRLPGFGATPENA